MSIQIKSLMNTLPVRDDSPADNQDTFNLIPTANEVYSLYTVPDAKVAIVKSIRLTNVNINAQTVNISLYFNRPKLGFNRRRSLLPKPMSMPAATTYIDDAEITLEAGDSIQGECNLANAIHYVISGVEREVT